MSGSSNGRIFWTTAAIVIATDVVTKYLAESHLWPMYAPRRVIGDVVRLTLAYNPGAAFGMSLGSYSRLFFGAFATVALVVLWHLHRTAAPGERMKSLALGFAWGGAAGNLIDRLRHSRGVVDFIDIGIGNIRFWTFNVADFAVTIGAVMLGWILLKEDRHQNSA